MMIYHTNTVKNVRKTVPILNFLNTPRRQRELHSRVQAPLHLNVLKKVVRPLSGLNIGFGLYCPARPVAPAWLSTYRRRDDHISKTVNKHSRVVMYGETS